MKHKLKIGFDFDGVIAYNPFRIIRPFMAYFKSTFYPEKKLHFWYPEKKWQQIFWTILHESSVFPANGIELFKESVNDGRIEAHLVTARYSFLDDHLYTWLDRHKLRRYFRTINLNRLDEQPHLFKERMIKKYNLDYFIEDNLDIVKYLSSKLNTKIYWIYNLLDKSYPHPNKFPYLGKAVEAVLKELT